MKKYIALISFVFIFCSSALAGQNKFGVFLSAFKPAPGGFGVVAAYNCNPNLRFTAGFGSVLWWSTVGVGAQYFLTSTEVRPYLGAQITHTSDIDFEDDDPIFDIADSSKETSGSIDLGLDWKTEVGFTMGLGASFLINSFLDNTVLPHLYIGWMF